MKINRKDIESLGWKYNVDSERYELDKSGYITYRYYYLYHRPGDIIYKSIISIYENGTKGSDIKVHKIEINTIEELKTLIKQLKIHD